MAKDTNNIIIIHGDKKNITVITSVSVFGHEFTRQYPMDFVICDQDYLNADAYLEVRKDDFILHETAPIQTEIDGYQSDGKVCELKSYQEIKKDEDNLPVGVYPLKKTDQEIKKDEDMLSVGGYPLKKTEKSGEWARFFPYVKINYFLLS